MIISELCGKITTREERPQPSKLQLVVPEDEMVKTFTADEFFEFIKKFRYIVIGGSSDRESGVYVETRTDNLTLVERLRSKSIQADLFSGGTNQIQARFAITGNAFHCDFENELLDQNQNSLLVHRDLSGVKMPIILYY